MSNLTTRAKAALAKRIPWMVIDARIETDEEIRDYHAELDQTEGRELVRRLVGKSGKAIRAIASAAVRLALKK